MVGRGRGKSARRKRERRHDAVKLAYGRPENKVQAEGRTSMMCKQLLRPGQKPKHKCERSTFSACSFWSTSSADASTENLVDKMTTPRLERRPTKGRLRCGDTHTHTHTYTHVHARTHIHPHILVRGGAPSIATAASRIRIVDNLVLITSEFQ